MGGVTHGHGSRFLKTPTYYSWRGMRSRCSTKYGDASYVRHGIVVCARWLKFENFLADMGERPEGKTLDRINNDGNYEPGNCRWATPKEQSRNSSVVRLLSLNGETHPISAWAEKLGISQPAINARLRRGWPLEWALTKRKNFRVRY